MKGQTWYSRYFERKWNIGTCQGEDGSNTRCCLQPGRHTLRCKNIAKYESCGWGNVSLEIQGQEYCSNFFGSMAFENVLISGKLT